MEQVTKPRSKLQQRAKSTSSNKKQIFLNLGTLFTLLLTAKLIRAAPSTQETTMLPLSEQAQVIQQIRELYPHLSITCSAGECDAKLNLQQLRTILSYMKPSADPCEDFHQYACGNWRNIHTNGTTTMKLTETRLIQKYIDLFERWRRDENEVIEEERSTVPLNDVQRKMLEYYKVCRSLEQSGRPTLAGYLRQMVQDTNLFRLEEFNWLKTLAELGRNGYSCHFVRFGMHHYNSTLRQLNIEPQSPTYCKVKWSTELGEAVGLYSSDEIRGEELKEKITKFERELLGLLLKYDEEGGGDEEGDNKREMTLAELSTETAQLNLDWEYYASKILERPLHSSHRIQVRKWAEIKEIARFLSQQQPELLRLYTMAHFLNYLQEQNPPNFLDAKTEINSYNCLRHMRRIHFVEMNYIYELEYYSKQRAKSDPIIQFIFKHIKLNFSSILQENAMNLTEVQLEQLKLKLAGMRLNIGNLPMNFTPAFFSDFVANLNISTHNFYQNHLQGLKHFYGHKHKIIDMTDQSLTAQMHSFALIEPDFPDMLFISPIYYFNMIVLPYAYLDVPFFSAKFWDLLILGDLANTLGHEVMHGFDVDFMRYDVNGFDNKILESIMENSNFKKNRECLDVGTEFLSERIADVGGMMLTISTFLRLNTEMRREEYRLFFLQFAQFFCGSTDLASFRAEDPFHDMDNSRLNYVLAQTPEFANIFKCPLGSVMNPEKRCKLW